MIDDGTAADLYGTLEEATQARDEARAEFEALDQKMQDAHERYVKLSNFVAALSSVLAFDSPPPSSDKFRTFGEES